MTTESIFNVEQLVEATTAAGANLEIRQLGTGTMETRVWMSSSSACLLQYLEPGMPIEAEGEFPAGCHALIVPIGNMAILQNGVVASEGEWVFLRADVHAWGTNALSPGAVIVVYIPGDYLETRRLALAPDTGIPSASASKLYPGTNRAAEFRRLARRWRRTQDSIIADAAAAAITIMLLDSLADVTSELPADASRNRRISVLDRAREYINVQIDRPFSMLELSEHTGTSYRTLRRIFANEMGLSPSQYIQARRLDAVRRALADPGRANLPIAEIATQHGLRHLGRFAATFRRQYGVLPSQFRDAARRRFGRNVDRR